MKLIDFLAVYLIAVAGLSCAASQPESRSNLVASRRIHLNGFGEIVGRVIDPKGRSPLPGANIILVATKLGAASDRAGAYKISTIPPGTYTIKVAYIGYKTVEYYPLQVEKDRLIILDFSLVADPNVEYEIIKANER